MILLEEAATRGLEKSATDKWGNTLPKQPRGTLVGPSAKQRKCSSSGQINKTALKTSTL